MTLRCHFLGHRRSASRATFDDKHQHWISECKRCHVLLMREPDGKWTPLPRQPDKLEPIAEEAQAASQDDEPTAFKAMAVA